jgi:predicted aconitase with swiveling domain
MDGEAGPCSVGFTVSDAKGAPVYDARIRVHIAYGFAGVRRLDLEAATNVDGKTQFKGLPEKVKGGILMFRASRGTREGSATYDPAKNCSGQQSSIVLTED